MNVSELKKEIESDKAFIEKVADRIYKDTDDWEETIPEPEWIDRMTEIADRYINRFELAQKIADKWIQCKTPQLNENQQNLVIWMQENECYNGDPLESISDLFLEGTPSEHFPDLPLSCVEAAYQSLNNQQKIEMVQKYLEQYLEQEEE